jgi:undecaprenyl-diphosphatase
MSALQLVVLAIVQGLTEFLPVSSSAHLILVSRVLEAPDQGLVIDVAVHLGTLFAALFYFRREVWTMIEAWLPAAGGGGSAEARAGARRLGLTIVLASLPVLLTGWLIYDLVATWLRDVRVVAICTLLFGVLLWLADRVGPRVLEMKDMTLARGLAIGMAQALALIPGTSRSGVTITMGRLLGFDAETSARFSFLLSIPVIALAGVHGAWKLATGDTGVLWSEFLAAVALSALAGWLCIAAFLALLRRVGLTPFIIYRLALGLLLLWLFKAPV